MDADYSDLHGRRLLGSPWTPTARGLLRMVLRRSATDGTAQRPPAAAPTAGTL